MYDKRTSLSSQVFKEIKKYFKDLTFKTTIPRNVRLAEAPSHGVPVGAYDKFSKGAKAYKDFTKELEERTKWQPWRVSVAVSNRSSRPI